MVGLPPPQERLGQEGESRPDSCSGRGTARLEQAQEPAPGGMPCWMIEGRAVWLTGGMGTRGSSEQQLLAY